MRRKFICYEAAVCISVFGGFFKNIKNMFEFIFQGTPKQFDFFKGIVNDKVPYNKLVINSINKNKFHCYMDDDSVKVFKVGMLLSACYSKFGHLESAVFNPALVVVSRCPECLSLSTEEELTIFGGLCENCIT